MKVLKSYLSASSLLLLMIVSFSDGLLAQNNNANSVVTSYNDSSINWIPCPDFMPQGCNIGVLHGDPTQRNSDVLLRLPEDSEIPLHTHTSAERMLLISGELEVLYEGENVKTMSVGSYAYGPPNKPHSATCKTGPCILFIAFEEPMDAVEVTAKH